MIGSAPGKVFVTGEYAVVSGGPAVVATVTRRLRARVTARPGRGTLILHMCDGAVRCDLAREHVDDLPQEARFVAAAALVAARVFGVRGVDLEIRTDSDLDPGTGKTGLGGSAAVTAATVSALQGVAGNALDDERARVAAGVYAHRLAQGGGSAADVIAASAGGLVWTERLDGRDVPRDVAECAARARDANDLAYQRLRLPGDLGLEVVATGRSCSTGPRVARYLGAAAGWRASSVQSWTAGMTAAAEALRDACNAGDERLVLRALRAAARLLSRLGGVASVPVFTPELRRACAVASTLPGTAAKPSGAGGGDCAIAVTTLSRREELRAAWRAAGLTPLALDLEPRGAFCEVTT